jgi:hypothetical protein
MLIGLALGPAAISRPGSGSGTDPSGTAPTIQSVTIDKTSPVVDDTITATAQVTPGTPTPDYTWTLIAS